MSNQVTKPMLSSQQLITKMKTKGITFNYVSEDNAKLFLTEINNYLRTASYRKNYQKYANGPNKGKYIHLDFSYLQELSIIDMHLRFLLTKMCSDIEHALKVQVIQDIGNDPNEDGYIIVQNFIRQNSYLLKKLVGMSKSPFTGDLLNKYFTIKTTYNQVKGKNEEKITAYNNCPIWVLCEFLTFGDVIRFYDFYYQGTNTISKSVLNLVLSLRNAAAHNNCILANLHSGTSNPPKEISLAIGTIPIISKNQAKKKLSCRPTLELVALFFLYDKMVAESIKSPRIEEIKNLFLMRMPEKKSFFRNNELIKTNYEFICKVIQGIFY